MRSNKVTKLAEQLRLQLHGMPEGNKPFKSARQTAAEFGVSRQTADRALRLLAEEGILSRIPGAGTWQRDSYKRRLKIACMINREQALQPQVPYSDLSLKMQLLIDELEAANCDFEFFSFYELCKGNFSNRLFDGFDGLIADQTYCDIHSRQMVCDFKGAKAWLAAANPLREPCSQVVIDFQSGFIELFSQARKSGIRKLHIHLVRHHFHDIIARAVEMSSFTLDDCEFTDCSALESQLSAYKYGLQLSVAPDTLEVCDLDIFACGIYEALLDRKFSPGDFALSGIGNIESLDFLPFKTPRITTIATPRQEVAHTIVSCVVEQIRHPDKNSRIIQIPAPVILRASAFGKID